MQLINSNLLNWKNVVIILLVAVIVQHFAKGWFAARGDMPK